jgi:RND family efflux transporter MFP subunit
MPLLQFSRRRYLIGASLLIGLGLVAWLGFGRSRPVPAQASHLDSNPCVDEVSVEVITPRAGGIDRICQQPGSIEPFQSAELYAKVSGYLIEQKVDIGDSVRVGDVLARIAIPEYEKQAKQDAAEVARAKAKAEQVAAAVTTAEADLGAASAAISLAQAEKKSKASFRAYREKQRDRIKDLVDRDALAAKTLDEQMDYYEAAVGADLAAGEAIVSAKQKEIAARARVTQAKADLKYAQAEVATAQAHLERSQVLIEYATIRSPYTGVITKRHFHVGDFIRPADAGGDRLPVLVVERTDVMRVVVQVPERDVPFVDRGDPAIVEIDALPGLFLKTDGANKVEISRMAASEDPQTRMMRTEIHVKNVGEKIKRGMFGRVTLTLHRGTPGALRIPSAALVGKASDGKGSVRIVRDGKAVIVAVQYGSDNGSDVEVVSGLNRTDKVIVRSSGPIENGTSVTISERAASGH